MTKMTSNKPYLIRAIYEWIIDNQLTPYLVVDATIPGVIVPERFVENGQIILNISPSAVQHLKMQNADIEFYAGFSGVVTRLYMPIAAIKAIYAFENGRGMMFQADEEEQETTTGSTESASTEEPPSPPKKGRPDLKVVK